MTFVITLADDYNHDGGVERQLKKSIEKLITSHSVQLQIFQNDNFGEFEEYQEDEAHHTTTSWSSSFRDSLSIGGGDVSLNETPPPAAVAPGV
jgi:hypothetical protein